MEKLPAIHFKLPEPKESNFTTDKIPNPKIRFNYGEDYNNFYSDNFYKYYLINVYDERGSEISRNEYHLYGNVMWIFSL
ncbi:hypothetical protein ACJMK2_031307, partial [Sinanodonta woodiana]